MKRHFVLFLTCLLAFSYCSANGIDSLKTTKDIYWFIKTYIPADTSYFTDIDSVCEYNGISRKVYDSIKNIEYNEIIANLNKNGKVAPEIYLEDTNDNAQYNSYKQLQDKLDARIKDSLKIYNNCSWVKTDINNDGNTDIIIIRNDEGYDRGLEIITNWENEVKSINAGYVWKYSHCKLLITSVKIKNKNVLLLFHYYNPNTFREPNLPVSDYGLGCDTLIVNNGVLYNYNSSPQQHKIEKLEYYNDGICEGDCPVIHVAINPQELSCEYSIRYFDPSRKKRTGSISSTDVMAFLRMVKQADFYNWKKKFGDDVFITDLTTSKWVVTFSSGETKTITDYGNMGNATLNAMYNWLIAKIDLH